MKANVVMTTILILSVFIMLSVSALPDVALEKMNVNAIKNNSAISLHDDPREDDSEDTGGDTDLLNDPRE